MSRRSDSRGTGVIAGLSLAASLLLPNLVGCSDGDGTVRFSAGPSSLAFAAARDGDGPWFVVEPSSEGEYAFPVTSTTYGIAIVCTYESNAGVTIVQATTAETTSPSFECLVLDDEAGSMTGAFGGATNVLASVHVAHYEYFTTAGSYTVTKLPTGQWDVFALRRLGDFRPIVPDLIVRKNAVTLAADSPTVLDFDFETEAFAPESRAVSFEGVQSTDVTEIAVRMHNRPGGTYLALGPFTGGTYLGLPASELRGDDIHDITATAYAADRSSYRQVRRWLTAPDDFTAVLPALPAQPQVDSEAGTPYIRMRGSLPAGFDADRYDFVYSQPTRTTGYASWTATLTRGYVATGATQYALPDLTSLVGFDPSWGLVPAIPVDWQLITTSSDRNVADLLEANQSAAELDGSRDEITQLTGQFPQ